MSDTNLNNLDVSPLAKRAQVYKAIDSERDYQDQMSATPTRPDMNDDMSIGDILLAIESCKNKAIEEWYKEGPPYVLTMSYLRKMGALCVKAGEKYPMPERNKTNSQMFFSLLSKQ